MYFNLSVVIKLDELFKVLEDSLSPAACKEGGESVNRIFSIAGSDKNVSSFLESEKFVDEISTSTG